METLLKEALDRVEQQYDIRVSRVNSRPGSVLPQVDVRSSEIRFNPKLESFLTLYNLVIQLEDADTECVSLFRLYNLYLDNDAYALAEEALNRLDKELASFVQMVRRGHVRPVRRSVEVQMLFFLLHEAAHAVFYHCPSVRQKFMEDARNSVKDFLDLPVDDLPDRQKEYLRTFVPNGLPKELQEYMLEELCATLRQHQKDIYDFSRYLQPEYEWMLEEFACDHFAWQRALVQYMEKVGFGGDAVLRSNIDLQLTLHIYAYDQGLQSIFTNSSEEEKIAEIREGGIRRAALRDCIYRFYKQIYPCDDASTFLHEAEERDERAKRLLVCSTVRHIQDMATLQDLTPEPFSEPRVAALEARWEEMEGWIKALAR